jgi:class 3 adenylate cyclase
MSSIENGVLLSSEDIKNLMLNMEKEQEILEAARKPLLIMLTDLKNSTVYYDRLGDVAAKSLIFKHNNILFPIIETNRGSIIKTTGDGILAIFENADDGVNAAIVIQKNLAEYNRDREAETTITVRIGLHYGKTIIFEDDVYGDSINAASRIEALADGEEVMISESVVQVANLSKEQLVNIGMVHLKGKLEPVNVFGLVWDQSLEALACRYLEKKKLNKPLEGNKPKPGINIRGLPEQAAKPVEKPEHPSNPFLNRSAISLPEYFCGREVLLHKVYSRLSASRPQSVSLYGERRIGKSSLLNQLRSFKLRNLFLEDNQHYIFINIDIQSMRRATVEHFIETLYEGIISCFSGNISFDLNPDYHDFARLVAELSNAGFVLIVMFDEFDLITLNPNFDTEFYSWLRSLASHYQVAYVTSSLTQLQQLCATKKISDSPFFNIFTAFHVGPFSQEETATMIRQLMQLSLTDYDFGPWLPEINDKAGYLPFFIQIYCSNLFDMYPQNPCHADVEAAYLEEASDHFEHICRSLCEAETECLNLISNKRKLPPKLEASLQNLLRKGYVKQDGDGYALFSPTFGNYFRQHESDSSSRTLWSRIWKR